MIVCRCGTANSAFDTVSTMLNIVKQRDLTYLKSNIKYVTTNSAFNIVFAMQNGGIKETKIYNDLIWQNRSSLD